MTFDHSPVERRRFGRRKVFKRATIVDSKYRRIACTIVDQSEGGVRIRLSEPMEIEGEFMLEVPEDDLLVRCRCVHVQHEAFGVEFIRLSVKLSRFNKHLEQSGA